jgi:nitroreductase
MNDTKPEHSRPTSDAVAALLRERRTTHDFLPERIADDVVERAIEVGSWAPNHHRTEPWRFYLLGALARKQIIERNTVLVRAAKGDRVAEIKRQRWLEVPGWLLMTCLHNDDVQREREDYAACCCAAQNMMLTLWADGIGTKWTTGAITRDPELFHMLGVHAAREFVVGLFCYGRPASVTTQQRRPLGQVLAHIE